MGKGMFQDVDVKIQVRSYLNFDVNVLKHAFFPWIITYTEKKNLKKKHRNIKLFHFDVKRFESPIERHKCYL